MDKKTELFVIGFASSLAAAFAAFYLLRNHIPTGSTTSTLSSNNTLQWNPLSNEEIQKIHDIINYEQ